MANKVVIDIEARLVDKVSSGANSATKTINKMGDEADKAKKKLNQLNNINVGPKIGANDSKFTKAMNKSKDLLRKLGGTKATPIIDAMDKASSKIGGITSKLKSVTGSYMARIGLNPGDSMNIIHKVSAGLRDITGKVWRGTLKIADYATAPIRKIMGALTSLKAVFMGVVGAFATKKLVLEPINVADAYSSAKIGFSTLLGDTAGQEMMDQLDTFAKVTPFKTSGVIANAQKMMAMGWDPKDIIADMEVIGNAAAATGKLDVGLESIVRALSQIKTKGRLSTEELNQLAEAGIAAKAMLAENLGYGTGDKGIAKMTKDLEDGAIASNVAIKALLQGMHKYDGMMDSMANETVEGLKGQLEDTFEINILRKWGQGLQDGAKRGFGYILELLDQAEGALQEFGKTVYDVGHTISEWSADKLQNAIERITKITDSFDYKNASLGDKLKMLWKGVISDPLSEWWENGGREKTAQSAEKVGKGIATLISTSLKALLGMTEVFNEGGIDESGGESIAKSFAKGFVDGFDVSGITDKLKEAISNVWNALPWWGKMLVGGYAGGKVLGGIGNLVGAASNLAPVATTASNVMASIGYGLTGAGAATTIGGISGSMAAGAGLGALTAGVGVLHIGHKGYQAYKDFKSGDKTSGWANVARAGGTAGGLASGAAIGASIGSVVPLVGTLIGAGVGTAVGWFAGNKLGKHIEKAKYESQEMRDAIKDSEASAEQLSATFEKAVWKNQKKHFGDMKLSMEEISRLSNQIVYGNRQNAFDKFGSATKQIEASYESLKSASERMERWNWKASLGVKFNNDEVKEIKSSVDEYINSAKAYVENKQYEFTTAVSLLVDVKSEKGKDILDSGNAYYSKIQKTLNGLGDKLSSKVNIALKDGVITLDEQKEITNLQNQIAEITNKLSEAETSAKMDLIKLKFGGGKIDSESFASLQSQLQTTIDERMGSTDKAFTTSLANLKLQLKDGAISQEDYDSQLQTLIDGYTAQVNSLKAEVQSVQLDIVADAYSDVLGKDGAKNLSSALSKAIDEGIDPKTWTTEQAARLLGVDNLTAETAGAIGQYLGAIADQLASMEVDGKLNVNMDTNASEQADKVAQEFKNSIDSDLQTKYEKEIKVVIDGQKEIREKLSIEPSEFGIPESLAKKLGINLTGQKIIKGHVILSASDFGVKDSYSSNPSIDITGRKNIMNSLNITASDFGVPSTISKSIALKLTPSQTIANKLAPWNGNQFRGGIVGYSDGGYVKGGGKLIRVAEEGDAEVIIPLSQRRRDRARQLWEDTGKLINADFGGNYATGGIVGSPGTRINRDAVQIAGGAGSGEQNIKIDIHGIELNVKVEGGQDVIEAIQGQKEELADEIAGIIQQAIEAQYQNMPTKKGA